MNHAESLALLDEPIVRRVTSRLPRVPLTVEFLGRDREIVVEIDHAPAEPGYPGYLNVTRAWLGDFEITDILSREDFEALAEMVNDKPTERAV